MKNKDHDYSIYFAIIAICVMIGGLAQCENARHLDSIRQELKSIVHKFDMMRYK